MAAPESVTYLFTPNESSIFAEVYFPKKVVYMSAIYTALQDGLVVQNVRYYLEQHFPDLLIELRRCSDLFDPNQYRRVSSSKYPLAEDEIMRRIDMYRSVVQGWSMYEVDGVFYSDQRKKTYDERVQVIRLIFRPERHIRRGIRQAAVNQGCWDVLQTMLAWVISEEHLLTEQKPWSLTERARFFARHEPWPAHKMEFAQRFYVPVMRQVAKWIDDAALYVFGFLVRRFWNEAVIQEGEREDEIWVTNFFSLGINRITRQRI